VDAAERAASLFAPVGSSDGWNVHFGRELNATEDRACLRENGRGVPVLEGKLIEPFRTDPGRARWHVNGVDADRLLGTRWRRSRLAYRDVASATNRTSLIAAVLPAGVVTTHSLFCLKTFLRSGEQHYLCGMLNSYVANYLVRLVMTTHLGSRTVEELRVPKLAGTSPLFREISDLSEAAARFGANKAGSAARVHALAAHAFELSEEEFRHVLSTFPLVPESDRAQALDEFRR